MTFELHTLAIESGPLLERNAGPSHTTSASFQVVRLHEQTPSLLGPRPNGGDEHLNAPDNPLDEPAFSSFLRSSSDATAVCSAEGVILYLNPAGQRLLGYNAEEIAGQKFASLLMPVPPDELALDEKYWRRAAANESLKARKKSGEIFPIDLSKAEVEARGGARLHVISLRDSSFQQRGRQHVAELQRELLHVARFTVLGELASAITHELRQPLAAITTYAAAAHQLSGSGQESGREETLVLLDKIGGQAQRCGDIIRKLKQLVSDRSIDRVFADLCTTVEEAVQLASLGAAKHNIHINVELPPQPVIILMDRSQILMLVSNLVRNALDELATWRYERRIDIVLALPTPEMVQLSVADTGPGILPAAFERMFDPFHTTKPEGSGMGLALSRRIAEAHNGRLAAANRPEGGAVFTFRIPMSKGEKLGE